MVYQYIAIIVIAAIIAAVAFFYTQSIPTYTPTQTTTTTPSPTQTTTTTQPQLVATINATTTAPQVREITIEADDNKAYPKNSIAVNKGDTVKLTIAVRNTGTYFGGLDFRSSIINTGTIKTGQNKTIEFVADKSFDFDVYWPASNAFKYKFQVLVS